MEKKNTNGIGLPLIALGLDILPVLLLYLASFARSTSFILLFIVLVPIAGLITGITALIRGKGQIGIISKMIAIIAVALPLAAVAFILLFFVGVMTGVISLM